MAGIADYHDEAVTSFFFAEPLAKDLPAGRHYVLVVFGEAYAQTRDPLGLTITVARQQSKTVSELSFLTAVHTAKGIAKQEGLSEVFACK